MPKVVTKTEWEKARKTLLESEKNHTRAQDALALRRRELPWLQLERDYLFSTEHGTKKLSELFGHRSQMLVYHFMYGPQAEKPCASCSFWADHFDGIRFPPRCS